jgi:catechol 2,3-dioxygenase
VTQEQHDKQPVHESIHPGVSIGHVNLKVGDLDRALAFWCGVLGFKLNQRAPGSAFVAAGNYHHHIALNTWESLGGAPPPPGTTGLYHVAILYPERAALADALKRIRAAGIRLDGAYDHGVSQSAMGSSSIGTGRRRNGREEPTAASRCSCGRSIPRFWRADLRWWEPRPRAAKEISSGAHGASPNAPRPHWCELRWRELSGR